MPHLERILVYPIKSLDGIALEQAKVLPSGALEHDRSLALVDAEGKFVNAKRFAQIHQVRAEFDLREHAVHLSIEGNDHGRTFHMERERDGMGEFVSDFFGFAVGVVKDPSTGFPDDPDCPGPTLIAEATLREIASWYPGMTADSMRRRLRANLHIAGSASFWEDQLYSVKGTTVPFSVGLANFLGNNPCQRCVVPPRDPSTGLTIPNFAKTFMERRQQSLPAFAERSRFNHFYRASVNTLVPPGSDVQVVCVGDEVRVGPRHPGGSPHA